MKLLYYFQRRTIGSGDRCKNPSIYREDSSHEPGTLRRCNQMRRLPASIGVSRYLAASIRLNPVSFLVR